MFQGSLYSLLDKAIERLRKSLEKELATEYKSFYEAAMETVNKLQFRMPKVVILKAYLKRAKEVLKSREKSLANLDSLTGNFFFSQAGVSELIYKVIFKREKEIEMLKLDIHNLEDGISLFCDVKTNSLFNITSSFFCFTYKYYFTPLDQFGLFFLPFFLSPGKVLEGRCVLFLFIDIGGETLTDNDVDFRQAAQAFLSDVRSKTRGVSPQPTFIILSWRGEQYFGSVQCAAPSFSKEIVILNKSSYPLADEFAKALLDVSLGEVVQFVVDDALDMEGRLHILRQVGEFLGAMTQEQIEYAMQNIFIPDALKVLCLDGRSGA